MFKKFDIKKYLNKKPPSDNSFTTMQELKDLNKIAINKNFVKEKDDVIGSFNKIVGKDEVIQKLVKHSKPIILKIKKHYNRPRPKELAKKFGIKMKDLEMKSMNTPSYPSGHSAQSTLIAKVLSDKYPNKKKKLEKLAKDISYSRNIAHAHYKSDSKFGDEIGKEMYEHVKNKI